MFPTARTSLSSSTATMTESRKRSGTAEETESIILKKIFFSSGNGNGSPLLSGDLLESYLIDNLTTSPSFPYLLGYYGRAVEEATKVSSMKDSTARSRIQTSITRAKNLAVSYSRLYIGCPELLGNSDATVNTSDLLSVIFSDVRSPLDGIGSGQGLTSPPVFVDEFFKDFDDEIFENIMKDLYERLRSSVIGSLHWGTSRPR